jgi:hypothetical protein
MSRRQRIPTYRLHKQSGQAIVTLTDGLGNRRDVLLGKYGTEESEAEYLRVITEWKTAGRRLPPQNTQTPDLTVNELALAYWRFAEGYYVKNGEPTKQLGRIKSALRPLKELYGHTPAREFGPLALKAVRERMLDMPCGHCRGMGRRKKPRRLNRRNGHTATVCKRCGGSGRVSWARKLINAAVGCLKRMFKWGVAEELVPATIYHGLQAVEGLKKGRSAAKETKPIRPVALKHVEAVLPLLMAPVRAMVRLEMLTACSPNYPASCSGPSTVGSAFGTEATSGSPIAAESSSSRWRTCPRPSAFSSASAVRSGRVSRLPARNCSPGGKGGVRRRATRTQGVSRRLAATSGPPSPAWIRSSRGADRCACAFTPAFGSVLWTMRKAMWGWWETHSRFDIHRLERDGTRSW